LFARVRSLLRVKALQDEVRKQAAELQTWNAQLKDRVDEQVAQIDRLGQLRRFFSPNVADAITSGGEKSILSPHRREICYVFLDLRGFTAFTDVAEPEEVEGVLREFHAAMGTLVTRCEGTVDRFAGDGILIFFNDPLPIPDPALRAARMALEMLGAFGFEGRWDYSAIGGVVNLAARLCDEAKGGQILINRRMRAALDDAAETLPAGPMSLKGFAQPVEVFILAAMTS
jgi:class 3 adenylate cyclase